MGGGAIVKISLIGSDHNTFPALLENKLFCRGRSCLAALMAPCFAHEHPAE